MASSLLVLRVMELDALKGWLKVMELDAFKG
jgi:hypothetical protein